MDMVKKYAIVPRINLGLETLSDEPYARETASPPLATGDRLERWAALDLFAIPGLMLGYAALALGLCAFFGRANLFVTDHYLLPFWSFYGTGVSSASRCRSAPNSCSAASEPRCRSCSPCRCS
jgi:hypothetical protein